MTHRLRLVPLAMLVTLLPCCGTADTERDRYGDGGAYAFENVDMYPGSGYDYRTRGRGRAGAEPYDAEDRPPWESDGTES
ncbi:MAG TPA: hypothetical protein VFS39_00365 [Nitrospira sp.]|nr:hypothetical protein [Nitrospira sp.]